MMAASHKRGCPDRTNVRTSTLLNGHDVCGSCHQMVKRRTPDREPTPTLFNPDGTERRVDTPDDPV